MQKLFRNVPACCARGTGRRVADATTAPPRRSRRSTGPPGGGPAAPPATPAAEAGFREIARLTRGAYFRFGQDSAKVLRELLAAVAVYAAGGFTALENHSAQRGGAAALLLKQMS